MTEVSLQKENSDRMDYRDGDRVMVCKAGTPRITLECFQLPLK